MAEKEDDRPVDVDIIRAPEEIPETESADHPAPVLTWVLAVAFVAGVAAVAYIEFRGPGQPASAPTTAGIALFLPMRRPTLAAQRCRWSFHRWIRATPSFASWFGS